MEIVVELVAQIIFGAVSLVVGTVIGALCLTVMLHLRFVAARVGRATEVISPDGELWFVRLGFAPSIPLGRRLTGMSSERRRRRRLISRDDRHVSDSEIWHPRRMVDAFDEAVGLVAPLMLLIVLGIAALVVLELILSVPIAIAMLGYSWFRRRWQVEVVAPGDGRTVHEVSSLSSARALSETVAAAIRTGAEPPSPPEHQSRDLPRR